MTGSDTSGAAQVAAAHCPNERTLDPAVCSQTDLVVGYNSMTFCYYATFYCTLEQT